MIWNRFKHTLQTFASTDLIQIRKGLRTELLSKGLSYLT